MKTKKKNFDYFESLVNMSVYALEEANLLKSIFVDFKPEELEEQRSRMHDLEHRCDMEKHDLTTALVKEFLPPVDRDDLFRLSHVTDNLTDSVESVVAFLYMADIKSLRADAVAFAELIIECCENAVRLLKEFRNFKKSQKLGEYIILINHIEEEGDDLYVSCMRTLHQQTRDPLQVLAWREVYQFFEYCFDACEDVADIIESITIGNT